MKGFRFRLEPVLAIRRHREEVIQRQLAESQRALEADRQALASTSTALERRVGEFNRRLQPGTLDMELVGLESKYLPFLKTELEDRTYRVQQQQERVAAEIEDLLQASRDKKALEKLEEKLRAGFLSEASRKDQNAAEEMASIRHLLRQAARTEY